MDAALNFLLKRHFEQIPFLCQKIDILLMLRCLPTVRVHYGLLLFHTAFLIMRASMVIAEAFLVFFAISSFFCDICR